MATGSADDALKAVPVIGTVVGIVAGVVVSGPAMYFSLYNMRRQCINVLREVIQKRSEMIAGERLGH